MDLSLQTRSADALLDMDNSFGNINITQKLEEESEHSADLLGDNGHNDTIIVTIEDPSTPQNKIVETTEHDIDNTPPSTDVNVGNTNIPQKPEEESEHILDLLSGNGFNDTNADAGDVTDKPQNNTVETI